MLTRLRRRPAVPRCDDAGITLTELVVTMSLLTIVGALALTAFIGTSDGSTRTTEASLTTAAARTTMSSWTDLLHVAAVPDPARADIRNLRITSTALSFNAQLGTLLGCHDTCATGATTAVTLQIRAADDNRKQLVQTLRRDGDESSQLLVASGAAVDGDCLFHPFGYDGSDLGCTPLTASESGRVGRVDIAFTVTPATGPVQQFRSSVKLPGAS